MAQIGNKTILAKNGGLQCVGARRGNINTRLMTKDHKSSSPPSWGLWESKQELSPYSQVSYCFHDSANAFLSFSCRRNQIRGRLHSLAASPEPHGEPPGDLHTSWVTPQRHLTVIPGSQHRTRASRAPHSTSLPPLQDTISHLRHLLCVCAQRTAA